MAHQPPRMTGYKHAGDEVWYKNKNHDNYWTECQNNFGQEENGSCSNSFWLKIGIDAHVHYMGKQVSGQCDRRQPSGTLAAEMMELEKQEIARRLAVTSVVQTQMKLHSHHQ